MFNQIKTLISIMIKKQTKFKEKLDKIFKNLSYNKNIYLKKEINNYNSYQKNIF